MIELIENNRHLFVSSTGSYNTHLNRREWWVNRGLLDLYDYINQVKPDKIYSVKDYIHVKLTGGTFPTCKECGAYCSFHSGTKIRDFCSKSCRAKNNDVYEKYKKTNLDKHGVENPFMMPQIRSHNSYTKSIQKGRDTVMQKYGVTHNSQIKSHNISTFTGFDNFTRTELSEMLNIPYSSMNRIIRTSGHEVKARASFTNIEQFVRHILESNNIEYRAHVRDIINPYELDFYIPSKSLAIELHGLYWHCISKVDKNYHAMKCGLCEDNGIKLLQLTDIEIKNTPDICKSMILSCLGITKSVYARDCNFTQIDSRTAREFHNKNHINGYVASKYNYGLMKDCGIVCVASFSQGRFSKKHKMELIRFSSKLGYRIVGGFSKIIKNSNIGEFITYANRRYSSINSNVYKSCGLEYIGTTSPNYFYTLDYNHLESRHKYKKHRLKNILANFDKSKTEINNMIDSGYDIFYDAGNNIYNYNGLNKNDRT